MTEGPRAKGIVGVLTHTGGIGDVTINAIFTTKRVDLMIDIGCTI